MSHLLKGTSAQWRIKKRLPSSVETQEASLGAAGAAPGPLHALLAAAFVGLLAERVGVSLTLRPAVGTLPLIGWPCSASAQGLVP